MAYFFILGLPIIFIVLYLMRKHQKQLRRDRLKKKAFPLSWSDLLHKNYALFRSLPPLLKEELQGHIQIFVSEKEFEGCGGLTITDEIKVTIAAQACTLLLNRKTDYYPQLYSILVYPSSFKVNRDMSGGRGHPVEGEKWLLGESWKTGTVILAWDHVLTGAKNRRDGDNLVFHEFSHQLDQEDRSGDGVPILNQRSHYQPWANVLSKEYRKFQKTVARGRRSILDEYGATNPAEFFSVVTEAFFERGRQVKQKYPELYAQLRQFYNVDTDQWY